MLRRVVIGQDGDGRSVVVSDEIAEERTMRPIRDLGVTDIWGADMRSLVPTNGLRPTYDRFFPPPDGFRAIVMRIGPEQDRVVADLAQYQLQRNTVLPGYLEDAQIEGGSELHSTTTVDVGVVLSGEITLKLDDGAAVELRPGDFFVQNGTRHSWHNLSEEPCVLAVFVVGAHNGD